MTREQFKKAGEIIREIDSIDNKIFNIEQMIENAQDYIDGKQSTPPVIICSHLGRSSQFNMDSEKATEITIASLKNMLEILKLEKENKENELNVL